MKDVKLRVIFSSRKKRQCDRIMNSNVFGHRIGKTNTMPYSYYGCWGWNWSNEEKEVTKLKSNAVTILYISRFNWFKEFWVWGCLPLIQKDSVTHMLFHVVNMREDHSFAWDSRLYICYWFYFIQLILFPPSVNSLPLLWAQFAILFHVA